MKFNKFNKFNKVFACLLVFAVALGFIGNVNVNAAKKQTTESNIVSKKLDTSYIKTSKNEGLTWYCISTAFVNQDKYITTNIYDGNKGIGQINISNGKGSFDTAIAFYNYSTGVMKLAAKPYERIEGVTENIARLYGAYQYVYQPDGSKKSFLRCYAYYDLDGNRISEMDFVGGSDFENGYAQVEFYKNDKLYIGTLNKKGKITFSAEKVDRAKIVIQGDYLSYNNKYYSIKTGKTVDKSVFDDYSKPDAVDLLVAKDPDFYSREEYDTFMEKYGSKWSTVKYLGRNRFYVCDKETDRNNWKYCIVNEKNKAIFTESNKKGSNEKFCEALRVDGELFIIIYGEELKASSGIMYRGIMDANGKYIVKPNKYGMIIPIDGGFIAGKDPNKNDEYNYQCILSKTGKELKVVHLRTDEKATLMSYYEGECVTLSYYAYGSTGMVQNQVLYFSTEWDFLNYNVAGSTFEKLTDYNKSEDSYYIDKMTANYKSAMNKTSVPSIMVLNLMSQVTVIHPLTNTGKLSKKLKDEPEVPFFAMYEDGTKKDYSPSMTITAEYNKEIGKLYFYWDCYDGADSYNIQYGWATSFAKGTAKETTRKQKGTESTTLTFSGMTGSGKFLIRVMPLDADGKELAYWTEGSISLTIKADSDNSDDKKDNSESEAAKKLGLTVECPSKGHVALKWNAIEGAAKYKIYYKPDGADKTENVRTFIKTELSFSVHSRDRDYIFRILALDDKGNTILDSGWSKSYHVD